LAGSLRYSFSISGSEFVDLDRLARTATGLSGVELAGRCRGGDRDGYWTGEGFAKQHVGTVCWQRGTGDGFAGDIVGRVR
jgi:hypothetical protein